MTQSQNIISLPELQDSSSSAFLPVPVGSADLVRGGATRISCTPQLANGLHFGIDTLHLSLTLEWSDESRVFELLDKQKKALQSGCLDRAIFVNGTESGILRLNLHRLGKKYYPFHLSTADINVFLSSRTADSSIPNCSIQIGSMTSQGSLRYTYEQLLRWLAYLGATVRKEVVTRIDMAADCLGVPLSALECSNQDAIVCRSNKFSAYYDCRKLTGVQLGKSAIVFRIYDKIAEMQANQNTQKEKKQKEKMTQKMQMATKGQKAQKGCIMVYYG